MSTKPFPLPALAAFSLALADLAGAATLAHRYSFNNDTIDSVGGNDGVLMNGATVDGASLVLTGLGTATGGNHMAFTSPVDLGVNFGATGVSIEAWYTDTGTGTWGKLFQFGQNQAGFEIGYTHTRGNGQMSGVDRDGARLLGEQITQNEEHHLVITVSPDGDLNTWVDGAQKLANVDTNNLSQIGLGGGANFEAIGATSWGDPGMSGSVNEFRIWRGELIEAEVQTNRVLGPDSLGDPDDSDNDGLADLWEQRWFGDDNLSQGPDDDPDMDGMTNLEEHDENQNLNPDDSDSDDDGLLDGREVNETLTNPLDADSDDDGLSDGPEVDTHMTDPLDEDSDDDLYGDATEVANGSDPNDPNDPGPLEMAQLAHRYSFTSGAELIDSAGGNTGVLVNTATVSDNQLRLDGAGTGPGASSMQFSRPVEIGGNFAATGVSIEAWYTDAGTGTWGKLFTFGTNAAGQEIAWTNSRGGADLAPGLDRNGAHGIASIPFGSDSRLSLDEEHHLVVSVAADGTTNLWIDGQQEITELATNPVSNIVSNTESIGSTAWGDPGHLGSVNEFRIWRGTLDSDDVSQNFAAGPDSVGGDGLTITEIAYAPGSNSVRVTWSSVPGRTYAVDSSDDLTPEGMGPGSWSELDDGQVATDESSSYEDLVPKGVPRRFYRVRDVTPN